MLKLNPSKEEIQILINHFSSGRLKLLSYFADCFVIDKSHASLSICFKIFLPSYYVPACFIYFIVTGLQVNGFKSINQSLFLNFINLLQTSLQKWLITIILFTHPSIAFRRYLPIKWLPPTFTTNWHHRLGSETNTSSNRFHPTPIPLITFRQIPKIKNITSKTFGTFPQNCTQSKWLASAGLVVILPQAPFNLDLFSRGIKVNSPTFLLAIEDIIKLFNWKIQIWQQPSETLSEFRLNET